jgi:mono/diheme cytochrome c family protein
VALVGLVVGIWWAACAAPQRRTIEPGAPGEVPVSDDSSFVLSRKPIAPAENQPLLPVHTGEIWWRFRADFLEISADQARARDEFISDQEAPEKFWDAQTALESVSLWTSLCNECHGGRRRVEDALSMPPPPVGWGRGEGLFFGKRRRFADVFAIVYHGGPERNGKRSEMPPWRGKISREQIWAVLYFLAYQSGGVEAPFPPSLQPRQSDEIRRVLE